MARKQFNLSRNQTVVKKIFKMVYQKRQCPDCGVDVFFSLDNLGYVGSVTYSVN